MSYSYAKRCNIVLVGQIAPILTLALGIFFLGSPVNLWTISGSLVSFGGIALTIFLGNSGQGIAMPGFRIGLGEIFVLIASVINATNNVISRLQLQSIPLGIFTIYSNILGTIIFFLLANILYGPNHFAEVFSPFLWQWMIVYALVIVVLGKLCWLAGLKKASATELNVASLLNPILAIIMAYLILGEVPTAAQYIGGSLLLVGVILSFIGNLYQIKANEKPAIPSPRDAMKTNVGFRGV